MGDLILITGGVRAGTSQLAEHLAHQRGGDRVALIATAEAGGDEMRVRIAAHRADRPAAWPTVEDPRDVAAAISRSASAAEPPRLILGDCLTMLVGNLLLAGDDESAAATSATDQPPRSMWPARRQAQPCSS